MNIVISLVGDFRKFFLPIKILIRCDIDTQFNLILINNKIVIIYVQKNVRLLSFQKFYQFFIRTPMIFIGIQDQFVGSKFLSKLIDL